MEDNYYARSQDDKLNNGDDTITEQIAMFIIAFFVTGFFATFAIIIILLIMYYSTKRWDKKLSNLATSESRDRHTQSNIFAVSLTMMVINIYAIALDITAIVTNVPCKDESDIHEPKILCKLPYIVFGVDVLGGFVWIICSFSAMISSCFKADRNHDEEEMPNNTLTESNCSKQKQYFLLAVSTLGPTATVVIHLPYIFIAYLNDAEHATSMFIYYIIVVFVIFAALNFAYITCQREIVAIKHEIEEDGTVIFRKCCSKKERQICCIKATYSIVVFPVFLLLILFLIGMITTAIFTTQITRSFDDTSNRLLGFYQTVIVLIGAYLLYNKYFKTKPSIESAVKKRDHAIPYKGEKDKGTWIKFSKKEKMEKFYDHFVDIIAKEACSNGLSTDAGGDGSPDAVGDGAQRSTAGGDGSTDAVGDGAQRSTAGGDGGTDAVGDGAQRSTAGGDGSTDAVGDGAQRSTAGGDGSTDAVGDGAQRSTAGGDGSTDAVGDGAQRSTAGGDGGSDAVGDGAQRSTAGGDGSTDAVGDGAQRSTAGGDGSTDAVGDGAQRSTAGGDGGSDAVGDGAQHSTAGGDGSTDAVGDGAQRSTAGGDGSTDAVGDGAQRSTAGGDGSTDAVGDGAQRSTAGGDGGSDAVRDGAQRSTAGGDGGSDAVRDGAQRSTVVKTMVEKIV